jgi:mannan endo-1,4-beta-mannosidase
VKEKFAGKKLITLSECGSIPYPELMQSDGAYWSYFMPWYGDFTKLPQNNSVADWTKILTSDFVITLDEMPDLTNYTSSSYLPVKPKVNPVRIYKSGNSLMVQWTDPGFFKKSISLSDLTGRVIFSKQFIRENLVDIPVYGYKPGIILITVTTNSDRKTYKVII